MLINCSLVFQPSHSAPSRPRPKCKARKFGTLAQRRISQPWTHKAGIWECFELCCPTTASESLGTSSRWSLAILHSSFDWIQVYEHSCLWLGMLKSTFYAVESHLVWMQKYLLALNQAQAWRNVPLWWSFTLCNCIALRSWTLKTCAGRCPYHKGSYSS